MARSPNLGTLRAGGFRWTTAHADLHWSNLTGAPLWELDWEGLQPETAGRVREAFLVLGTPAGLAAEATVCAQLLQTVSRGDNLVLEDRLRDWSEDLCRRQP
ncbi:hypothetical protein [Streptomyces chartreusis]|uniref:hypothetical protein n=1 Tax=Streptomyces chartreusis TaxID=1969 RepID=UPI0036A5E51B